MQVTFMVKLMVSLIDELKSKGFEICNTDVTEDEIKDLTFQNDDSGYSISIFTENEEQREYLKVAGGVKKEIRYNDGFQVEPLMKELKCDDRIIIRRTEDGDLSINLRKLIDAKFSMEGINKDATKAIALDIIGSITN